MSSTLWVVAAVAVVSGVASLLAGRRWLRSGHVARRVKELEVTLEASVKERAAERRGRIRAQQVEGVHGRTLLISGADLVDGTPVLDVKPYLPYCDAVPEATAPPWVKAGGEDDIIALTSVEFSSSFNKELSISWEIMGKFSLYSNPKELQELIEQVLSRDIRSLRQRKNPNSSMTSTSGNNEILEEHDFVSSKNGVWLEPEEERATLKHDAKKVNEDLDSKEKAVVYRLTIDGFIISYTVDSGHVVVHGAEISSSKCSTVHECNHSMWTKVAGSRMC